RRKPRALPLRDEMRTDRRWAAFLAAQDLVWGQTPTAWYQGPFLGNGRQATMIYQPPGRNALRFDVQHSEVQDHRPPRNGVTIDKARLPIGAFFLEPEDAITGVDLRLDLWNAELWGTVITDRGELALRAFIHAEKERT
ncbi:MAG: glycosyl hydrolase family 95 catalytic domain-containing protein, partial [Solirubrobacteraceae bacterium]